MKDCSYLFPLFQQFAIEGTLQEVQELKIGHIHDTYCSSWITADSERHFIHQKLNTEVFPDIDRVMETVQRVTRHIQEAIRREQHDSDEICLVVPAASGALLVYDAEGHPWRTYTCIERSTSYQVCPSELVAEKAAACCGRFQRYVADCDVESFPETIQNFHRASFRYAQLDGAIADDRAERKDTVSDEIAFALERRDRYASLSEAVLNGTLPRWLSHNDLKLNNVLFRNDVACSLVDLDTYMPGSPLLDFGDLVRVASTDAKEDEPDLDKVHFKRSYFEALADGYWGELNSLMSDDEWALISCAPAAMTLTIGIRFLTDYLNGDTYFKTEYPAHNRTRARVQFRLVEQMEQEEEAMKAHLEQIRRA